MRRQFDVDEFLSWQKILQPTPFLFKIKRKKLKQIGLYISDKVSFKVFRGHSSSETSKGQNLIVNWISQIKG